MFELFETSFKSMDIDVATKKGYKSHDNEEIVSTICGIFSTIIRGR